MKQKVTSAIMITLFLLSIMVNAFSVSAQSTECGFELMKDFWYITDGYHVENTNLMFDPHWEIKLYNDGPETLANVSFSADLSGLPVTEVDSPTSIIDSTYFWELGDVEVHTGEECARVNIGEEQVIMKPGYNSSRSADVEIFQDSGYQTLTVNAVVEEYFNSTAVGSYPAEPTLETSLLIATCIGGTTQLFDKFDSLKAEWELGWCPEPVDIEPGDKLTATLDYFVEPKISDPVRFLAPARIIFSNATLWNVESSGKASSMTGVDSLGEELPATFQTDTWVDTIHNSAHSLHNVAYEYVESKFGVLEYHMCQVPAETDHVGSEERELWYSLGVTDLNCEFGVLYGTKLNITDIIDWPSVDPQSGEYRVHPYPDSIGSNWMCWDVGMLTEGQRFGINWEDPERTYFESLGFNTSRHIEPKTIPDGVENIVQNITIQVKPIDKDKLLIAGIEYWQELVQAELLECNYNEYVASYPEEYPEGWLEWAIAEPLENVYTFWATYNLTRKTGITGSIEIIPGTRTDLRTRTGYHSSTNTLMELVEIGTIEVTTDSVANWEIVHETSKTVFFAGNEQAEGGGYEEVYTPEGIEPYFALNVGYVTGDEPTRAVNRQMLRMMAQNLADLGIEVHLLFYDFGEWVDRLLSTKLFDEGGYDSGLIGLTNMYVYTASDVAQLMRELCHSTNAPYFNVMMWNNTDNDALLDAAVSSTNETEIEVILREWQALFYEEQPAAIAVYRNINGTDWPYLGAYSFVPFNMQHPIFGTGTDTPLGQSDPSQAAEAAKYVRQAISYTINRTWLAQNLPPEEQPAEPGITPIIRNWPSFDPSLKPYSLNLTEARRLLSLAGYGPEVYAPEGIEPYFTLNVGYIYDDELRQMLCMMAQSLADLGIEVHLHFYDVWGWIDRLVSTKLFDEGGYDSGYIGLVWPHPESYGNISAVAQSMHECFHSTNVPLLNVMMWNNTENDVLLDAAVASTNETEIEMLLHEWQALFYEEQPAAIVTYSLDPNNGYNFIPFNMLHPVFGTGTATPLGQEDPARAAEAARYVRQAISHAVNRTWAALPGITPILPTWPGFDPSLEPYSLNLTEARRLLSLAGYGMFIAGASPISLLVTDSQGRRVGCLNGEFVNEIPGAYYSGVATEPQIVYIPWPQGEYITQVTGTDSGSFTLTITQTKKQRFSGEVTAGTTRLYMSTIHPEGAQTHEYVPVIYAPVEPVQIGTSVTATATVTDYPLDICDATWDWGDSSTSPGTIEDGTITGSHIYDVPGVYTVTLVITDNCGNTGTAQFEYVVVYDPEGGFVTGGGWFDSPEGAYTLDPSLSGKATFGFVSKYKKGASTPSGQTQFVFHVAGLKFQSTNYEWLVVAGARAQYKGSGTINGEGDYGFMLTAIDGQLNGGGGVDKFRIKIWDKATGEVIYDNQLGDADDADATTAIQGGSIVIHKAK